ncbi:MAG: calcium/sodium antiporter [Planctomycetes bacterium]|nr:calcium/sodium antiporter [Planctomycetota bacterium]
MAYPIMAMVVGIAVLIWSADKFVEGAAAVAIRLGMSQLLIGMVIIGFGTSLPEMLVSAISAWNGSPGIALGNAYGSNIANITLILGVTALVRPIPISSGMVRKELYTLIAITAVAVGLVWWRLEVSRLDAIIHLGVFAVAMALSMRRDAAVGSDELEKEVANQVEESAMGLAAAIVWVVAGLALLMASSRALVWGAVETATRLGVSELTIGLTVVAVGTSLPELASSLAAARKGRHDMAVGNIIGSNLFTTLAVVGIAGVIHPMRVAPIVVRRDLVSMCVATVALFLLCIGRAGRKPVITRTAGAALVAMYVAYTAWVVLTSAN